MVLKYGKFEQPNKLLTNESNKTPGTNCNLNSKISKPSKALDTHNTFSVKHTTATSKHAVPNLPTFTTVSHFTFPHGSLLSLASMRLISWYLDPLPYLVGPHSPPILHSQWYLMRALCQRSSRRSTVEAVASLWNLHKLFPAKSPRSQDLGVPIVTFTNLHVGVGCFLFQHHFLEDPCVFCCFKRSYFSWGSGNPL